MLHLVGADPVGASTCGTIVTHGGTVCFVATNLRLSEAAAEALRRAAEATGRSQQQLLREAVAQYLGLDTPGADRERARTAGLVRPGTPFRDVAPTVRLPDETTIRELLDPDADPR